MMTVEQVVILSLHLIASIEVRINDTLIAVKMEADKLSL